MTGGSRCHQQATAHTLAAFCLQTERLCASRCRLACITSSGKRPSSEALTKCHLQKLDETETSDTFSQAMVLLCRCKGNNRSLVAPSYLFRPTDRLRKSRGTAGSALWGNFVSLWVFMWLMIVVKAAGTHMQQFSIGTASVCCPVTVTVQAASLWLCLPLQRSQALKDGT